MRDLVGDRIVLQCLICSFLVRFQVLTASMKLAILRDVEPCSMAIALMMEAVSISETSVKFYHITRRNMPEDSHIHVCYLVQGNI
jgi:hypothetical protein